uniref:Uncharacterized protein n=1 Tax=Trichinella nativa TaxID=6335 RepID=A0A0V1KJ96_9BILA
MAPPEPNCPITPALDVLIQLEHWKNSSLLHLLCLHYL